MTVTVTTRKSKGNEKKKKNCKVQPSTDETIMNDTSDDEDDEKDASTQKSFHS